MTRKFILTAAAAAFAITGISMTATDAEAGRNNSRYKQWEYDTTRPVRGYQGFAGGTSGKTYCSYHREPQRKCWDTRDDDEVCKIVGWRLIQRCY